MTDDEDDGGLTAAGWPRERVDGWPIPWISPRRDLKRFENARYVACSSGALCSVCGEGYQADERAIVLTTPPPDQTFEPGDVVGPRSQDPEDRIIPIDNGVMHRHCTRLALAWCPKLRELRNTGRLVALSVVAHDAETVLMDAAEPPRGEELLTATYTEGVVLDFAHLGTT